MADFLNMFRLQMVTAGNGIGRSSLTLILVDLAYLKKYTVCFDIMKKKKVAVERKNNNHNPLQEKLEKGR